MYDENAGNGNTQFVQFANERAEGESGENENSEEILEKLKSHCGCMEIAQFKILQKKQLKIIRDTQSHIRLLFLAFPILLLLHIHVDNVACVHGKSNSWH
jgi:hypothetical protein